jgi:hypothetical protein
VQSILARLAPPVSQRSAITALLAEREMVMGVLCDLINDTDHLPRTAVRLAHDEPLRAARANARALIERWNAAHADPSTPAPAPAPAVSTLIVFTAVGAIHRAK